MCDNGENSAIKNAGADSNTNNRDEDSSSLAIGPSATAEKSGSSTNIADRLASSLVIGPPSVRPKPPKPTTTCSIKSSSSIVLINSDMEEEDRDHDRSRPNSPVAAMDDSNMISDAEKLAVAPVSRDSAAGSGYSSPYSERATPPHLRWARKLEDVLDDYEGMQLFTQYLSQLNESHLLQFWYGCHGLRQMDWSANQDRVRIIAERLYADYVAPRGKLCVLCLSADTRSTIRARLMSGAAAAACVFDQTLFDQAIDQVKAYLRDRHAQFATSDTYIVYIQDVEAGGWDSPKCYSQDVAAGAGAGVGMGAAGNSNSNSQQHSPSTSSSSSGDLRRPSNAFLPTVHEEEDAAAAPTDADVVDSSNTVRNVAEAAQRDQLLPQQQQRQRQPPPPDKASSSSSSMRMMMRMEQRPAPEGTTMTNNYNEEPPVVGGGPAAGATGSGGGGLKRRAAGSSASNSGGSAVGGSGGGGGGGGSKSGATAAAAASSTTTTGLTSHALAASFGQRLLATKTLSRVGIPPNPYHAPYVPYLPTSAQDSELQSMSSGATTESGFSGSNFQRKEQQIMRFQAQQNRDTGKTLPRTNRSNPSHQQPGTDMLNRDFERIVLTKLHDYVREIQSSAGLMEALQSISEPENDQSGRRAAVQKFYTEERSRQPTQQDNAEEILDQYCSRVPYLKDSPRHSPMRSPGLGRGGRRRSPIAKSPIRAMIASYPSGGHGQQAMAMSAFSAAPGVPPMSAIAAMSQSVMMAGQAHPHPQAAARAAAKSYSGHHSAGNTIHRATKHEPSSFAQAPQQIPTATAAADSLEKRPGAIPKKLSQQQRYPQAASDTSGISSGTSAEPSLVCAPFAPPPAMGQRGMEQQPHWIIDRGSGQRVESSESTKHKMRPPVGTSVSEQRSHRSSSHRGGGAITDKSRGQRAAADSASSSATHRAARRSDPVGGSGYMGGGGGEGAVPEITVGIFLPNEETPYLVRFLGRQITFKQFKQLVPRKGNFRYFFQCISDELGTGTVHREVVEDNEILPLCDNKVVAKIVPSE